MSRFAIDPQWLVYLPPTMSPCETSRRDGYLEHPDEAFAYFRAQGVPEVVCQEKHMGSRAVVVVARDPESARARFGSVEGSGAITTRTGRSFFSDAAQESAVLDRLRAAMTACGFWDQFDTSWAVLDCELMPWSAKALELLKSQYAATGAAAQAALPAVNASLAALAARLGSDQVAELAGLQAAMTARETAAHRFTAAYSQYCWSVASTDDYKLAPFHLLATEGRVHSRENHAWHMQQLSQICRADTQLLLETPWRRVDVTRPEEVEAATAWWIEMTARGGEGMVVKPLAFEARGPQGLVQPAVKCRGPEYLRIIYGPDYLSEAHLARLRNRALGAKRSLALREFALGIEALERFVRREPLRRVHECVFGVLALESEPVDPRL